MERKPGIQPHSVAASTATASIVDPQRLTAHFSRDLFEFDHDCGDNPPDEVRRCRERLIIQLLKLGYDVTLSEPMSKLNQAMARRLVDSLKGLL